MAKKAIRFISSQAKDFIRDVFDFEVIRTFQQDYYPDQPLAYLGLPGEDLLDVLSWRSFIGRWTAVQIADTPVNAAVADHLVRNALLKRLERDFQPVRADIDVLLSAENGRQKLHWPYQIVNLDYYGGLVNATNDHRSRRIEALQGLFFAQERAAFILFLTLNLRDRDRGELSNLVNAAEEELLGGELQGVADCFRTHRELGHAGELKIYVPVFLASVARKHTLIFHPPILYQGTQQMIHFAIQCIPYTDLAAGRLVSTRDRMQLINLPLLILHSGDDLRRVDLGQIL